MASYIPTQCLAGFNAAAIHVGSDTFKLALGTGTVPTANRDSANEYYGGSDFTEASGAGYTAGGAAITLVGAQYTTGGVHQYAVSQSSTGYIQWTTATLASVTYAYLYDTTSATKYAICVWDFGGAQSVTANTFQVTFTDTTPNYRVWYWGVS